MRYYTINIKEICLNLKVLNQKNSPTSFCFLSPPCLTAASHSRIQSFISPNCVFVSDQQPKIIAQFSTKKIVNHFNGTYFVTSSMESQYNAFSLSSSFLCFQNWSYFNGVISIQLIEKLVNHSSIQAACCLYLINCGSNCSLETHKHNKTAQKKPKLLCCSIFDSLIYSNKFAHLNFFLLIHNKWAIFFAHLNKWAISFAHLIEWANIFAHLNNKQIRSNTSMFITFRAQI